MTMVNLGEIVSSFNKRQYDDAAVRVSATLQDAVGQDELFWMGLLETCQAFSLVMQKDLTGAEPKLLSAMEKLRNFGYRHNNLEVTGVLAGLRLGLEEVRNVRSQSKTMFDVSLLPKMKMAAEADTR
jgi:hypothetical protein